MRGSGMIDSPSECGGGARGHLCDRASLMMVGSVPGWCSEVTYAPSPARQPGLLWRPKASSLLWLLPPRVIDGGQRSLGESGACLGVMGGWQLSGLCHCSPAWSVPPLGLLCCSV